MTTKTQQKQPRKLTTSLLTTIKAEMRQTSATLAIIRRQLEKQILLQSAISNLATQLVGYEHAYPREISIVQSLRDKVPSLDGYYAQIDTLSNYHFSLVKKLDSYVNPKTRTKLTLDQQPSKRTRSSVNSSDADSSSTKKVRGKAKR